MATVKTTILATVTIILLISNTATSLRDFPMDPSMGFGLAARLQATEGDTNDCWSALAELRQCSNEVIGFFLNGQTDIDTPCCNAIEFITRKCWPSMLGVLGFTAQEGSLLAGYCNKASAPASAPHN
ncbi:egg cell-secreted protein 1.4-like [Silene latifolia]|uniref:egg cell-secreted protein 1.4-like n=1 Tax=Silene latifolia TaxID=37657 RepID=UPI003D786EA6